jgi:hypothetical protein
MARDAKKVDFLKESHVLGGSKGMSGCPGGSSSQYILSHNHPTGLAPPCSLGPSLPTPNPKQTTCHPWPPFPTLAGDWENKDLNYLSC